MSVVTGISDSHRTLRSPRTLAAIDTARSVRRAKTSLAARSKASVPTQHQRLDRQQQRLDTQQHRMHDADGVNGVQHKALEGAGIL